MESNSVLEKRSFQLLEKSFYKPIIQLFRSPENFALVDIFKKKVPNLFRLKIKMSIFTYLSD